MMALSGVKQSELRRDESGALATQRIRDKQIHVYGEVSDAQLLWWRRLAEREDVRISIDDVTILLNGDSSHVQNALIAKFRGDFLLIQVSKIPCTVLELETPLLEFRDQIWFLVLGCHIE